MNYFVNENIFTLNSGTEFSAVQRLKLFRANKVPAQIVTRNYNSQLSADIKRVGLTAADVVNMYDYFQEVVNVPEQDVDVRYVDAIDKLEYHIEGVDANESLIKHAGRVIGKVRIAPATVGLVGMIEYYNDLNEIVVSDIWDRRGFKSSTQYYHPGGQRGSQVFFDYQGKPKIEITHMNINGNLLPTMYKLLDYKGNVYRFNTEQELFIFFLNELASLQPSVFINDRPSLISAVAAVQGAVGKWQFLHNAHASNNLQAGASRQVVPYLQDLFTTYKEQFDGVLVPTKQQATEISKFYQFKKILAVPDTFSSEHVVRPFANRPHNRVVYLGRMSGEKNPIDVLEILALARQSQADLHLDFFGYPSPSNIQEEMNKKVEELGLKEAVTFRGYQAEEVLGAELDQASVLLNVSSGEGFGMNVLEAMSHGVPAVAYNVKYGLAEMIDHHKNGFLVPYASINEAAKALLEVLADEGMVQAAYEKAQEFNAAAAWSRWSNQKVIANNLFVN